MGLKTRRSKACDIPKSVKDKVWARDGEKCIVCGNPYAMPSCHYRSRSQGGLGIEQNIVTLCQNCHYNYDHTIQRKEYAEFIRNYLKSKYADWKEEDLLYRS